MHPKTSFILQNSHQTNILWCSPSFTIKCVTLGNLQQYPYSSKIAVQHQMIFKILLQVFSHHSRRGDFNKVLSPSYTSAASQEMCVYSQKPRSSAMSITDIVAGNPGEVWSALRITLYAR